MILGYFDFAVIGTLLVINILIWRKRFKNNLGCLFGGIIFGLLLPLISIKIEMNRVTAQRDILDNFTMLYTFFKFPIYWILGSIQMAIISNQSDNTK